jgi:hypothetical protein
MKDTLAAHATDIYVSNHQQIVSPGLICMISVAAFSMLFDELETVEVFGTRRRF